MSDDLRDAIAQLLCADDNFNWAGESWDVCGEPVQDWWRRKGDAVLAMPEIVDLLALRAAIPGDDKLAVAEWAVKIAAQHLISTDRTRYVTAERLNALDALMDATDACPPSVRAALLSNGGES